MTEDTVLSIYKNFTSTLYGTPLWNAHIYTCAIVWFILGLYVFIVGINLHEFIPSKALCQRACGFLVAISVSRTLYLMIDAYEAKGRLPAFIMRALFSLTSPFQLIIFFHCFIGLLRLTRVNLKPYELQGDAALSIISIILIVLAFFSEALNSAFNPRLVIMYWTVEALLLVCILLAVFLFAYYGLCMLLSLRENKVSTAKSSSLLPWNCCFGSTSGLNSYAISKFGAAQIQPIPKIRIIDENDREYSYHSVASSMSDFEGRNMMQITTGYEGKNDQFDRTSLDSDSANSSSITSPIAETSTNFNNIPPCTPGPSWTSVSGIVQKIQQKTRNIRSKNSSNGTGRKITGSSGGRRISAAHKPIGSSASNARNRVAQIRTMIRWHYVPAILLLIYICLSSYEICGLAFPKALVLTTPRQWLLAITLTRLTELLIAVALIYEIRMGFNRL